LINLIECGDGGKLCSSAAPRQYNFINPNAIWLKSCITRINIMIKNVLIITNMYYLIQLIIIQRAFTSVTEHWDFSSDYKNNLEVTSYLLLFVIKCY